MAPRRRCATCGSRQWHKEPSSGLVACSEGHILQDYRNETTEITEAGPHAMKKRTIKSKKRQDAGMRSKANPKLYYGARARYHYFLCLQFILRQQVAKLTELWKLPPEFEIVCRDLWALHLALLPDPPTAEPYHHLQDGLSREEDAPGQTNKKDEARKSTPGDGDVDENEDEDEDEEDGEDGEGAQKPKSKGKRKKDKEKGKDRGKGKGKEKPANSGSDDADDDDDNEDEESEISEEDDPELAALMQELSDVSSSSDDEEDDDDDENNEDKPSASGRRKKKKGHPPQEGAVSTLVVLVLGCWMMRVPVILRDLTRLIEGYELPYLDPVVRILPESMVLHLTKGNVQALSPPHAPSTMTLGVLCARMAKAMWRTFGIETPEYNAPSALWRLCKAMGGTPTIYRMAKRVGSVVSVPLTLYTATTGFAAPGERRTVRAYDSYPPEVGLMACIVIVLKLVYGLDGQDRVAKEGDDVACAMPCKQDLMSAMEAAERQEEARDPRARFSARNAGLRVGDMTEAEMDAYIGFCGQALLGRTETATLERYFPTDEGGEMGDVEQGDRDETATRAGCWAGDGLRPGRGYKMWKGRDVLGETPVEYGTVIGRAAAGAGVEEEALGVVLCVLERRLARVVKRRR